MTQHLTDKELIDYIVKFSDDDEKVRLATYMERLEGSIIDDLMDAGMDETWCTFRSEWGGEYHPGQYIRLLEDEIRDRDYKINQLHKELEELKTTTIVDFIADVKQELHTAKWSIEESRRVAQREKELRIEAEQKWDMWDKLHHGIRS